MNSIRRRPRKPGLAAVYGALALALATVAACSAPNHEAGRTVKVNGKTLTQITFTQPTATTLWAPINVAEDLGLFKKNGLDVKVTVTGGASQALAAVLAGSAQIAGGGLSDDVQLAGQGKKLVAFASLVDKAPDNIAVTKEFASKSGVSPTAPIADRVHALKGATIGITSAGALPEQILSWLLDQYGMSLKDIKTVPLHDPATALAAMKQGRVDGIIFPPPGPQAAVNNGNAVTWVDVASGEVKPGYWTGLITSPDYIQQHPDVVEAMAKSVAEALEYIKSNSGKAAELIKHHFPDQDQAAYDAAWKVQAETFAPTIDVTQQDFSNVMNFLKATDVRLPTSPNFDDVATNSIAQKVGATS